MNRPPVLFTKALQIRTMGYGTCRLFHDRMADASFFNDHPCLYSGGMLYDCGTLGGLADPFAMNSSGVLVRDGTLPSLSDGSAGAYHAFIYANGRIADLNSLVNLQGTGIRAQVGSGTNALVAGVVVGGQGTSGSEPILLPASGPALAPLGVTGVLPDPKLQLNNSGGTLATNNGWGGSAAAMPTPNIATTETSSRSSPC